MKEVIFINTGNSEAAEQVVHMMISGGEVAVKLAGSAAKNAAAVLLALAREQRKVYGKTSLKKILRQTRDVRVFPMTQAQYKTFCSLARGKILYAGIGEKNRGDAPIDVVIPTSDLELANGILERVLGTIAQNKEEHTSKKEHRSERCSADTVRSLTMSEKKSKSERPSIGEQLQSFREMLSGVEPHVPTREKTHGEITK